MSFPLAQFEKIRMMMMQRTERFLFWLKLAIIWISSFIMDISCAVSTKLSQWTLRRKFWFIKIFTYKNILVCKKAIYEEEREPFHDFPGTRSYFLSGNIMKFFSENISFCAECRIRFWYWNCEVWEAKFTRVKHFVMLIINKMSFGITNLNSISLCDQRDTNS